MINGDQPYSVFPFEGPPDRRPVTFNAIVNNKGHCVVPVWAEKFIEESAFLKIITISQIDNCWSKNVRRNGF